MDCKTAQQKIMPYIERKLNDRETEAFIDHIRGCGTCSEELEVYFTIYYALEQLDKENQGTYNIKELLERDLRQMENRIKKHGILRFYRRLMMTLIGMLAAVFLLTAVQAVMYGSFEETTLYNLFSNETEMIVQTETQSETVTSAATEETEQETNRKRQVIVTIPETEAPETAMPLNTQ